MYMLWFNFILGSNFFSFVSNSLSCYYHTLSYPKTKEKKIWTKDKVEPQHIHVSVLFYTLWCTLFFSVFITENENFCSVKCWSIIFCCIHFCIIHLSLFVVHCCWIHFYCKLQRCIRDCLIYLSLCTLHTFLFSTFLL